MIEKYRELATENRRLAQSEENRGQPFTIIVPMMADAIEKLCDQLTAAREAHAVIEQKLWQVKRKISEIQNPGTTD